MVGLQLFFAWNSYTKECISCFIWVMKDDTDPKERFVSYKFTPSILQNGRQNYMENKDKGNEHKIILEDFNCTMDKMDRDGENKHNDLTGPAPVMPCQNSSWITSLRIYGEGRTQIPLSSPATIGPLARIQDRQGLY